MIDHPHHALLLIPRLQVQNVNAISSFLTWGFPAMTSFLGFMNALERRLGSNSGIRFNGIGVVCHRFEPQQYKDGGKSVFSIPRTPLKADGSLSPFVSEWRAHMNVSLLIDAYVDDDHYSEDDRALLAENIMETVSLMRLSGGSIFLSPKAKPSLSIVPDDVEDHAKAFLPVLRRLLPGFALIARNDLLQEKLEELQQENPEATALDALLEFSKLTYRAENITKEDETQDVEENRKANWKILSPKSGWFVPIPVGFYSLSPLYEKGTIQGARDSVTPFQFVEPVWSIGQWLSPHRFTSLLSIIWKNEIIHLDDSHTYYRCSTQEIN